MLPDGRYDVIVVDAEEAGDAEGAGIAHGPNQPDSVRLELAILAGDHKGEMVAVTATGLGRDPLDLLAEPATLTVVEGRPSVDLDG